MIELLTNHFGRGLERRTLFSNGELVGSPMHCVCRGKRHDGEENAKERKDTTHGSSVDELVLLQMLVRTFRP